MKPIHEMTAAEALEEANRRSQRRAAGLPLEAPSEAEWRAETVGTFPLERVCEFCRKERTRVVIPPGADVCPRCWREPLEKSEQADVVKLYRAFGVTVYSLSQPRASKQSEGIPDLWCVHRGKCRAWWHETKRPVSGTLSPAQKEFAAECQVTHTLWFIGGVAAARMVLVNLLGVDPEKLPG